MITIGTAKFDFKTSNEPFAQMLNTRWDSFFHTCFERVADEVLSFYDQTDSVITISSLSLDLGNIEEEQFEKQFSIRLREVLEQYCKENLWRQQHTDIVGEGVRIASVGKNAFDMLSFFLLHGYFPFTVSQEHVDLSLLLKQVINEEAYRFREFLNSYGHYDFLCRRMVFQFTDDELEQIVNIVQPSESKFISLYVRVQIRTYDTFKRSDIARDKYREMVWTLVLAYLFAESGGRFNRKQIVLHTIRGLAAHLNLALVEVVQILTESIRELERTVEQLPELWAILKEIRQDMKAELWALDGDYHVHLMREVAIALHAGGEGGMEHVLSREHLISILSNQNSCRELLRQLQEQEIHLLVSVVAPWESEYIISYACMLDKHKDAGTFSGKAGSEFYLLKWEFIFGVLVALPASVFNRKQFVLSVLQRLAAHYNLSVAELIDLLLVDKETVENSLSAELWTVLQELKRLFMPRKDTVSKARSAEEWLIFLQAPLLARKFFQTHTERQAIILVKRLFPAYSEFLVNYATLLDKGYEAGMLKGKAGGEFTALKWEFIFSCFFSDSSVVFHQKIFVYSVLRQLAAHYNQEVTELLGYFLHNLPDVLAIHLFGGLKLILQELYDEKVLPLTDINKVRSKSDAELEHWILDLFGDGSTLFIRGKEEYLEKWLMYFLNERNEVFRFLWKTGKLNTPLLLRLVNRTSSLRNLWLHKIGDGRLAAIYNNWSAAYVVFRSRFAGLGFLQQLADYLSVWMVELTASKYAAWSETEIIRFLTVRIRQNIPPGFATLLDEISWKGNKDKNVIELIHHINELNGKETFMEKISINNAGLAILSPFFPRFFRVLGYLDDKTGKFKDDGCRVRAIFVMQYLIYGEQREYPETDLCFNKLLVNRANDKPLPRAYSLSEKEIETAKSLIASVKQMWEVMRHVSDEGFRQSFFQRNATLSKGEESDSHTSWIVQVEERAYDVLLDRLPWSYKLIKFSWIDYMIQIKWRG